MATNARDLELFRCPIDTEGLHCGVSLLVYLAVQPIWRLIGRRPTRPHLMIGFLAVNALAVARRASKSRETVILLCNGSGALCQNFVQLLQRGSPSVVLTLATPGKGVIG